MSLAIDIYMLGSKIPRIEGARGGGRILGVEAHNSKGAKDT